MTLGAPILLFDGGLRPLLSSFTDAQLRDAVTEALGIALAADADPPVPPELRDCLLRAADAAVDELDRRRRSYGDIYDVELVRLSGGLG
jgi:hypothetical protein